VQHRVLVVDDDRNILQLFEKILSKGGYAVRTVQSGSEALKVLSREGLFDLLILDLCMPEPDGFDVLREVRFHYPGLRTLVVSGYLGGALLSASECLGATATLNKSKAPESLLLHVNHLLVGNRSDNYGPPN
jgi:DNA-binding NtrC family response regulator